MNAVPIILAAVMRLCAVSSYRARFGWWQDQSFFCNCLVLGGIALLSGCIFAFLVLTLNYVFSTFTSLQVAAWDVSLVISTSIGLILSWIMAAAVGGLATKKLITLKKKELESAT